MVEIKNMDTPIGPKSAKTPVAGKMISGNAALKLSPYPSFQGLALSPAGV